MHYYVGFSVCHEKFRLKQLVKSESDFSFSIVGDIVCPIMRSHVLHAVIFVQLITSWKHLSDILFNV